EKHINMKTYKLFTLLFFILSTFTFSQRRYVDVVLVKTNNDTIHSKMMVIVNLFNKKLINDASFYKKAILVDENEKKKAKIKAKEIKSLSFTNLFDNKVNYVNDGNQLKVLVYDGKIKWYQRISQHMMDGSISYHDYLVNEAGEVFQLGLFNHRKNQLSKAIADNPELLKVIENQRMDNIDLLDILKRYNDSKN
ncbi:MAG: hypothetical protein RR447_10805, partial [Algoriella sp.]